MTWETPTLTEIAMNAEIGSYQDDLDRPGDDVDVTRPAAPAEVKSEAAAEPAA